MSFELTIVGFELTVLGCEEGCLLFWESWTTNL